MQGCGAEFREVETFFGIRESDFERDEESESDISNLRESEFYLKKTD